MKLRFIVCSSVPINTPRTGNSYSKMTKAAGLESHLSYLGLEVLLVAELADLIIAESSECLSHLVLLFISGNLCI